MAQQQWNKNTLNSLLSTYNQTINDINKTTIQLNNNRVMLEGIRDKLKTQAKIRQDKRAAQTAINKAKR